MCLRLFKKAAENPFLQEAPIILKKLFLDAFFPQYCLACGKEGDIVCSDCLSVIDVSERLFCPFCVHPVPVEKGKCFRHRQMNLDGLFAVASYQDPLVQIMVKKMKYEPFLKELKKPLSQLIIAHFLLTESKLRKQSLLVPVPLASRSRRKRGFNQAEEICRELAAFFSVPVLSKGLLKIKETPKQAGLNRADRISNVNGVFMAGRPGAVKGKNVYLVDDVFTTGATMEECARVLKSAGAKEVWGVAVAREVLS